MREYRALRTLRRGEVLELEGLRLRMDVDAGGAEKPVVSGDLYVAERNTGPQLLTAKEVVSPEDGSLSYVIATTMAYPYDRHECVKVVEAS